VTYEGLANSAYMGEIDQDVASVWISILNSSDEDVSWLCKKILEFNVTLDNVQKIINGKPRSIKAKAFRTIIKNRMHRGGILAPGSGLLKAGESNKGLHSRWYPETLVKRISIIRKIKRKIVFKNIDAFDLIQRFSHKPNAFYFIDPPYTIGGKRAGKRLYSHNEVDHDILFQKLASVTGSVMLTYDDSPEVRALARRYKFKIKSISMMNSHNATMRELIILKP